jgi:hypothetical protein
MDSNKTMNRNVEPDHVGMFGGALQYGEQRTAGCSRRYATKER